MEMEVSRSTQMKAKLYRNRLNFFLVVKLELDTANHASAAKLVLKIRSVSDGNKEDLNEAVNQAGRGGIMALPSVIGGAVDTVQTADTFVQGAVSFSETWGPILEKLRALQSIGDYLSEVISLLAFSNTGDDLSHAVDPSIRKIGMVDFEYHSKGKFISFDIARR
jgi:hypothetical protein